MNHLAKPLALYVHVPFCKAKCTYCDFYSIVGRESSIPLFIKSLKKEIRIAIESHDFSSYYLDTIFLGGGTPNLLNPSELEEILLALHEIARSSDKMEIGMEINPGEADYATLLNYKSLGINRMSIGMQSFQPELLKFMSRIHSVDKSISTYDDVRKAGFNNVSADLIFAVPGQTRDIWKKDLEHLVSMAPEHISTYSLTIEEGTALHRWVEAGHIQVLADSVDTGMYAWGREYLESQGYPNYEISNHAKPGYECRHNLNYWTGVEYLGFGPAAHSFFRGRRHWNVKNLDEYLEMISQHGPAEAGAETIGLSVAQNEMILTRLRLTQGIDLDEYSRRFGKNLLQEKQDIITRWKACLMITENHLQINRNGWALIDEISSDLMTFDE